MQRGVALIPGGFRPLLLTLKRNPECPTCQYICMVESGRLHRKRRPLTQAVDLKEANNGRGNSCSLSSQSLEVTDKRGNGGLATMFAGELDGCGKGAGVTTRLPTVVTVVVVDTGVC